KDQGYETPVVMLTAFGSIEHAVAAIQAGAINYLLKPFSVEQLQHVVSQALDIAQLRAQNSELRREVAAQQSEREIVGKSAAVRRLLQSVAAAAASRATVLLEGESGTGKELLARAVHEQSDRARGAFIRINCAAVPEGLFESTLFGHERGAFTGAIKRTLGAFERADGGTLLLDEIGEMRLDLQAKLLRVLQEREFERVGGTHPIRVDVRIIGTTNRDLAAAVQAGLFRADLYYRLSVFPIRVPPLRDRRDDIPLLAFRFATRAASEAGKPFQGFAADALDLLRQHDWPGNVRELQHAVERAIILATSPMLETHLFAGLAMGTPRPAATPQREGSAAGYAVSSLDLQAVEREIIAHALMLAGGNRSRAAEHLGIDVRTLRRKLNQHQGDAADADTKPLPTVAGSTAEDNPP
ncbi:MAG TPA: sigma-54 dependent transcriptional regulator, partial [Gemmatimonadaceae bacterium]|nr:sigma-54 dependent transcriptional regulator [Gemmatimonadaceae bacterium]